LGRADARASDQGRALRAALEGELPAVFVAGAPRT
jgi:hypothetical protein